MSVCVEEMTHLAQVANLTAAIGSRPHFDRPNLPVPPGYHPAGIQAALRPFTPETLDHFIYLERPEGSDVDDGEGFSRVGGTRSAAHVGWLMPSAPDYRTIGEFYGLLEKGFRDLTTRLGERALFVGADEYQLRSDEIGVAELSVVSDLKTAQQAIELIIVQGEGSTGGHETSHFERFLAMRREYQDLLMARPEFVPGRPVAHDPVMRAAQAPGRVHVTAKPAAELLDATNAVYSLMLRCLVELYDTSALERPKQRAGLLKAVLGLMKILSDFGDRLTTLPARDQDRSPTAGVTFAMLRSTEGFAPGVDAMAFLGQRFVDIENRVDALAIPEELRRRTRDQLRKLRLTLT